MEQYIIPAAAAVVVAVIEALAARGRRKEKKAGEEEGAQQKIQEKLMVQLIQGSWAAIALGEATARAVQRIPDAHCNGDMSEALKYATGVKHQQKEYLAKIGVHAAME